MFLPTLSIKNLSGVSESNNLLKPSDSHLHLPERILQFGTGVLLRGLPDYYVDKANKTNIFNGRIVVVKSTNGGDFGAFENQDCLFTHSIAGLENGKIVEKNIINTSISRVLQAQTQWRDILDCAENADIDIVFSNTTEYGLAYSEEIIADLIPASFPGKMLAYLHHRYTYFNGDLTKGLTIVPTELLDKNGDLLKGFVLDLAEFNKMDESFIQWLKSANTFCNSLVDRIVPGVPEKNELKEKHKQLGYTDDLLLVSEPFGLWAIEGDAAVIEKLSFSTIDSGVKIIPDISIYKELKLRLLNATHILSTGKAILSGFHTVREAMNDQKFEEWIKELMSEIDVSLTIDIAEEIRKEFEQSVFSRFANPFIEHHWSSITLNFTTKMKIRVIPLIDMFVSNHGKLPEKMCYGFAAYLRFSIPDNQIGDQYFITIDNAEFLIKDQYADYFYSLSASHKLAEVIHEICANVDIWGKDLTLIPGFFKSILNHYLALDSKPLNTVA
ncbi:MAG: tagaturonate reductase [Saprospiraceae bacterium]|jgi:tagaturonate reductase|nr:tagaturonate reductase [Saprospiraceae bacterium]